jgi:hypothetical protein
MTLQVRAPVAGRAVRLADVPDEVFAQGLVGPGTAINPKPAPDDALAPVSGLLAKLHPHAFVVVASGRSPVCPVVALDAPWSALSAVVEQGEVATGTRCSSGAAPDPAPVGGRGALSRPASGRARLVAYPRRTTGQARSRSPARTGGASRTLGRRGTHSPANPANQEQDRADQHAAQAPRAVP